MGFFKFITFELNLSFETSLLNLSFNPIIVSIIFSFLISMCSKLLSYSSIGLKNFLTKMLFLQF